MMTSAASAQWSLFPAHSARKIISAETMPYTQMLHTGLENDTFYMRGRFAVDFPIVGYNFAGNARAANDFGENFVGDDRRGVNDPTRQCGLDPRSRCINFGIVAATHISMIPTTSMRFPVDNFYATLAIYFSGETDGDLSWRFYPVYHVSAHLADGYRGGDILRRDVRAVSSEMVRGEIYYTFFNGLLELGAGAGWYYHVCAQKNLSHRADVSLLVAPDIFGPVIKPFALMRGEAVSQGAYHLGTDVSVGVMFLQNRRGMGVSLRYFNKLHSSYYFEEYERGVGAELLFQL